MISMTIGKQQVVEAEYRVPMHCNACERRVGRAISKLKGFIIYIHLSLLANYNKTQHISKKNTIYIMLNQQVVPIHRRGDGDD